MPSSLDAIVTPSTGGMVPLKALALKRKSCFLSTPPRFFGSICNLKNNAHIIIIFNQVMASMVLQRAVVESLLGFTSVVAEHCGDLLDGQSVDLEVGMLQS